jgi:hypothetical protein
MMAMSKIFDGAEQDIGTLRFHGGFAAKTMTAHDDSDRVASRWTFRWNGGELRGTAALQPSGDVIRNVALHR